MKQVILTAIVTTVLFEVTRYTPTMQLETITDHMDFDGKLTAEKASAKVKKAVANKDQIVIVKSVSTVRRTYVMDQADFKFYAKLTEIAEDSEEGEPVVNA